MKIKKYLTIFASLFKKGPETFENFQNDIRTKTTLCVVLSLGSLLLTIINIFTKSIEMMYTTIALTSVFALSALLVGAFKLRFFAQILVALVVGGVFSYYAWIGGNEGFAILWIAIVPLVAMLFLDFTLGFALSLYFLLFLIILLYILPIFGIKAGNGYYQPEFFKRFPALYLISFVVSLFISGQRIYYLHKAEKNSLYDSMTGLKNRRFYSDYISSFSGKELNNEFTVISIDLNNLKIINDMYGHNMGDVAIIETGNILSNVFGKDGQIFRTGGDEFFVFFNDDGNEVLNLITKIKEEAKNTPIKNDSLSLSVGFIRAEDYRDSSVELLVSMAERNMYLDKEEYYRNFHGERRRENLSRMNVDNNKKKIS